MSEAAEYVPGFPVHLAIDCGVSRHVAAVWFQVSPVRYVPALRCPSGRAGAAAGRLGPGRRRSRWRRARPAVGGDRLRRLPLRRACIRRRRRGRSWPTGPRCRAAAAGRPGAAGPGASARTGIGPTAYAEFERVFGAGPWRRWPSHRVHDGLDQLEVLLDQGCLLLHPRCTGLKAAFQNYARRRTTGGDWLDEPADPQHPHEDLMDALRGGVRDRFPEGRIEQPRLRTVPAGTV